MTTPKPKLLVVLIDGEHAGDLTQNDHGRLTFTYQEQWRTRRSPTPLSMPVSRREHPHQTVDAFLRGLLPDSDNVLKRWGTRYGVSPNSPFALLTHVGQDVAGAAQFVLEEDVDAARETGRIEPLDDAYIGERLRILRADRAAWDDIKSPAQFSLAGAQSKFALYGGQDGSWGVPFGRRATTHIFKPPLENLAHQEVNEHLCLSAARRLGMRAARSEVKTFGDERAVVVTRYDRIRKDDGSVIRVHQEDFCQALSIDPARKYERGDGGPGAVKIIQTLREHQSPQIAAKSVEMFCRALAYNWVIYGPDAHAKSYSLLLSGRVVRLAPLYDISSVAPYPDRYDLRTMVMAMSINGSSRTASSPSLIGGRSPARSVWNPTRWSSGCTTSSATHPTRSPMPSTPKQSGSGTWTSPRPGLGSRTQRRRSAAMPRGAQSQRAAHQTAHYRAQDPRQSAPSSRRNLGHRVPEPEALASRAGQNAA